MVRIFGYTLFLLVIAAGVWGVYQLTDEDASRGGQAIVTPGLEIEDISVGTGTEAKNGDILLVHYRGTLENGTEFDSSYVRGEPFNFVLGQGQVIKGWDIGLIGMKVGGTRRLKIFPELAYGQTGAGGVIPPNATLMFEVSLLEVQ